MAVVTIIAEALAWASSRAASTAAFAAAAQLSVFARAVAIPVPPATVAAFAIAAVA